MKHPILLLLCVSLVGTSVYNHALSWNNDDLPKMGIAAVGAAALLYFFTNSSDDQETLSYRANDDLDELYFEGEQDVLLSEFLAQQKQRTQTSSGLMSYLPGGLCAGVLGYFGYTYLKNKEPDLEIPSKKIQEPVQPEKKESFFGHAHDDVETIAETVTTASIWEQVTSSVYNQATMGNTLVLAGMVGVFLLCNSMVATWQNPEAQQALLYEDIAHCYKRADVLYKRVCERMQKYQKRAVLTSQEGCAITTYITEIHDTLREYYIRAGHKARSLGGYNKKVSAADMAQLSYWDRQVDSYLKEIERVELQSRGDSGAQLLGQQLEKEFETRAAEEHSDNADEIDDAVGNVVEDEHVILANTEVAPETAKNEEHQDSSNNNTIPEKKSL